MLILEQKWREYLEPLTAYGVPISVGITTIVLILSTMFYFNDIVIRYRFKELENTLKHSPRQSMFDRSTGMLGQIELLKSKLNRNGLEDQSSYLTEAQLRTIPYAEEDEPIEQFSVSDRIAIHVINSVRYLLGKQVENASFSRPRNTHLRVAYILERKRDYRNAIVYYDSAALIEPELQAEIFLHEGFCQAMVGNYIKALSVFSIITKMYPFSSEAMAAKALYQKVNMLDEIVRKTVDPVIESGTTIDKARRLFAARKFEKTLETLRSITPVNSKEESEVRFLTARCFEELGREPEAIDLYREFIIAYSGSTLASLARIRLLIMTNHGDVKVLDTLRQALAGTGCATLASRDNVYKKEIEAARNMFRNVNGNTQLAQQYWSLKKTQSTGTRKSPAVVDKKESASLTDYFTSARINAIKVQDLDSTGGLNQQKSTYDTTSSLSESDFVSYRVMENRVPCFSSASSKDQIVYSASRAEVLTVLSEQKDWFKVRLPDFSEAWIRKEYLRSEHQIGERGLIALIERMQKERSVLIVSSDSVVLIQLRRSAEPIVVYAGEQLTLVKREGLNLIVRTAGNQEGKVPPEGISCLYDKDKDDIENLKTKGNLLRAEEIQKRQIRIAELIRQCRNTRVVERTISRNSSAFMRLYEERLKRNPGLRGSIKVSFQIRPDGVPDSIRIVRSTISDNELENSVIKVLTTFQFTPLPGDAGYTRHEYSIPFIPVSGGALQ